MEINPRLLGSRFILKTNRIKAGETLTVGAMLFAKKDGTRLNPFVYKPNKFTITCKTPNGKDAIWNGVWG